MKNPYKILGVPQNADKKEIHKAQMLAMRRKEHSLQEISAAARQLLDPAKRLATDFMFPVKIKAKRITKIEVKLKPQVLDLKNIDENSFDSL